MNGFLSLDTFGRLVTSFASRFGSVLLLAVKFDSKMIGCMSVLREHIKEVMLTECLSP